MPQFARPWSSSLKTITLKMMFELLFPAVSVCARSPMVVINPVIRLWKCHSRRYAGNRKRTSYKGPASRSSCDSGRPPFTIDSSGYSARQILRQQMRIALRNCGIIDPENIDDYLSLRGYEALAKVLTDMTPKQVIEEVKLSGLRGRGGAGFPTGVKWQLTSRAGSPNSPRSISDENMSSATPTRATLARLWTEAQSKATRTQLSRE